MKILEYLRMTNLTDGRFLPDANTVTSDNLMESKIGIVLKGLSPV